MRAVATAGELALDAAEGSEWPVSVAVTDSGDGTVLEATIRMWVSPRSMR